VSAIVREAVVARGAIGVTVPMDKARQRRRGPRLSRRRLNQKWRGMGVECMRFPIFLDGGDDAVQNIWDAVRFPFLTTKPKWVRLGETKQPNAGAR
jgi:hypothetical protein